jgi:hypothetical protein
MVDRLRNESGDAPEVEQHGYFELVAEMMVDVDDLVGWPWALPNANVLSGNFTAKATRDPDVAKEPPDREQE